MLCPVRIQAGKKAEGLKPGFLFGLYGPTKVVP
jgi:hypothetical protein